MNTKRRNFWMNVALSVFFLLTTISIFLGEEPDTAAGQAVSDATVRQMWSAVHYIAGTLFLIGCAIHTGFHWKWIRNVLVRRPKKLAERFVINLVVDIWLFVIFLLCGAAGLVIWLMEGILPNPFVLSLEVWDNLHLWTGRIMLLGVVVHLACHWKSIVSPFRRKPKTDVSKRQQQPMDTTNAYKTPKPQERPENRTLCTDGYAHSARAPGSKR